MSARASGNPGGARLASRVVILVGLIGLLAGPLAPLTAAAGGITVTTPFPAVVAEPGTTASFELTVDVATARQVDFEARGVPSGWTARFRGGGLVIDGAYIQPKEAPKVTFDVEIPAGTAAGTSTITIVARGGGGSDALPVTVRVADAAAGDVKLTTDSPELRGAAGATFSFNVTLHNDTAADTTFAIDATGPAGWTVSAKPGGQAQATSMTVKGGASGTIAVSAQPPADVSADTFPITVTATGGGKTASIDLSVIITGTFTLSLTTPDQVLSTTANAGTEKDFALVLNSTGSAPVTGITLSAGAPTGWKVEFDPATIPAAAPGTPVNVTAKITPSSDAIAGDYEMTITAKGAEATDDVSIRVRVETPQLWWVVGVLLIVLVFAGLYWVFRRYGRR